MRVVDAVYRVADIVQITGDGGKLAGALIVIKRFQNVPRVVAASLGVRAAVLREAQCAKAAVARLHVDLHFGIF